MTKLTNWFMETSIMKLTGKLILIILFTSLIIMMQMISGEEFEINTDCYIPFDLEVF